MIASAAAPYLMEQGAEMLKGKPKQERASATKIIQDSLDKPNKAERYVKMALGD